MRKTFFERKLKLVLEELNESNALTLYKGVSYSSGLKNWPKVGKYQVGVVTPGFLGNIETAIIYSEPSLTGNGDKPSIIAEFRIDPKLILDRSREFVEWCDRNGKPDDISINFPPEWEDDKTVWTVKDSGSGHYGDIESGVSFVYCGIPQRYRIIMHHMNQQDWESQHRHLFE